MSATSNDYTLLGFGSTENINQKLMSGNRSPSKMTRNKSASKSSDSNDKLSINKGKLKPPQLPLSKKRSIAHKARSMLSANSDLGQKLNKMLGGEGSQSMIISPQKLFKNVTKNQNINLLMVYCSQPMVYLIISFSFMNMASFYFNLKTRSQKLSLLYYDQTAVPLMMTESVMCSALTCLWILINHQIPNKKFLMLLMNLVSLLAIVAMDRSLKTKEGLVLLSLFCCFLMVNSQILLTVIMAECVDFSMIHCTYPILYSSYVISYLLLLVLD